MLPTLIRHIAHVEDGGPVLCEHTGDARYARDADGRTWIRKRDVENGYNVLLAEAIGWLLGKELDAPIPEAAIHIGSDGGRSWLSSQVMDVVHWNKDSANYIMNLRELGSVFTLDVLLLNEDRHSGNILLQPEPDRLNLRLWAIDQGNGLVGYASDYPQRIEDTPDPANLARGIPLELIEEDAKEAAGIAAAISERTIREIVRQACLFAPENEEPGRLIADTLVSRCANASALVERYFARIRVQHG